MVHLVVCELRSVETNSNEIAICAKRHIDDIWPNHLYILYIFVSILFGRLCVTISLFFGLASSSKASLKMKIVKESKVKW